MKKLFAFAAAVGVTLASGVAAQAASASGGPATTEFEVTITNVSQPGLLDTPRAGGTVPLSPGVYSVARGASSPMFRNGQLASDGIEDIAEDGNTAVLLDEAEANKRTVAAGVFSDGGGPIFSGNSATFTIDASPGDRLFLATMFVQSNDFFLADDGKGIRLFNGNDAVSGDVTATIDLWDSGTEADTAPGTGPDQKPVQLTDDQGPDENSVVLLASQTGDGFDLPAEDQVIKVTITPLG